MLLQLGGFSIDASQSNRSCYTSAYNLETHPYSLKDVNIQNILNQKKIPDSICIPIVVHNVYKLPEQKVDLSTVLAQIKSINTDFNANNSDVEKVDPQFKPLVANIAFRFFLIDKDLAGNDFEGINYLQSDVDTFRMNQYPNVKLQLTGIKPWKPNEYINIWVCNLEAGISGYASYPTAFSNEDGIVIHYQNFGKGSPNLKPPLHLGRTLTHELGHYFGLKHLYGDEQKICLEDDGLADTPLTNRSYTGCPQINKNLNLCNDPYSKQDMVQNFMNQTNDDCMHMFTHNQKTLMQYHLMHNRKGLVHQNCFITTNIFDLDASIQFKAKPTINCDEHAPLQVKICNEGLNAIHSFEIKSTLSENISENYHIKPNQCIYYALAYKFELAQSSFDSDIVVSLKNINGLGNELNMQNNSDTSEMKTLSKADFPFEENFTSNPQWLNHSSNIDDSSWILIKENNAEQANELPQSCCGLNNSYSHQIHYLHLPYFNLTEISASTKSENFNFCLNFDYAFYAGSNSTNTQIDGMIIEYASTCSPNNFKVLWEKWGKDLETTSVVFNSIDYPNTASDWKTVHQNLNALHIEGEKLLFRIKFINNNRRSIFIDNISFNFCENIPLDIQNYITEHEFGVFPNPSLNGQFHLYSGNPKNLPILVEVFDALGLSIASFQFQKHYSLSLNSFPNGCYFVKMQFDGYMLSKKLILSK